MSGKVGHISGPASPFIVTAEMPPDVFAWANALRQTHFPSERNICSAHVTLFHALPPSLEGELRDLLQRLAAEHAPPPARVSGLINLGGGTAIKLTSEGMTALRQRIADHFHGALTAQDRHKPRLHITIQNKVTREAAQQLQTELGPQVKQRNFAFTGLALHIYRGGPWQAVGAWRFRGRASAVV
ncbi:2'-5' RNA ligase family protein [Sphingobium sp. DEHP117]|uniref:2'-5' RNA ligase family protein n=1 Tax=Sphingobium sp. DEHP117 TaxID=2993436 RepID=UPI0027D6E68A|nr:2'-5' RNA ligase family protein [Sphingobium sp. DEHP117]MDQ4420396.1 2'-5' RNA ligase family protein [Sphingobium sp. DEHP117]